MARLIASLRACIIQEIMMENIWKSKFDSDADLPLKKILEPYNIIIAIRSVFHEGNECYPYKVIIVAERVFHEVNKYYPQIFSGYCSVNH